MGPFLQVLAGQTECKQQFGTMYFEDDMFPDSLPEGQSREQGKQKPYPKNVTSCLVTNHGEQREMYRVFIPSV